jgi:rod shape-determining protein MreC
MRNLLRLIVRYYFFFLFLFLEAAAIILVVQNNSFQRAGFIGLSRSVEGFFYETFGGIREYFILRQTNRELQMENTLLRNQLDGLQQMNRATAGPALDSLPVRKFTYLPAGVINVSTNKQLNFLTLDKGRHHGVEPEMAVVSPRGVVGVIYAVSGNYASVIPLINRNFRLSAKIRRNGYFGSLSWPGTSYDHAVLEEIPYHAELMEGDTIVTSGYSAIFPEGILVGTVESFEALEGNFYTIRVKLSVDYKTVSHVNVIRNLLREEQLELERITGND